MAKKKINKASANKTSPFFFQTHRHAWWLLPIFMVSAIFFIVSYNGKQARELEYISVTHQENTSSNYVQDSTVVDLKKNKVGDKIGVMKITYLSGYKTSPPTQDNAFVFFNGKVSITGDVEYFKDGSWGGERVCMETSDKDSLDNIPKLFSQTDKIFFCFTNLELAKQLLVTNVATSIQGKARVIVDNYKIQRFPEAYNTAELISIAKDN